MFLGRRLKRLLDALWAKLVFAVVARLALRGPHRRELLIWCPMPLINIKHWAGAMRRAGEKCETLVNGFYPIHKRSDFDRYYEDLAKASRWTFLQALVPHFVDYLAFLHVMRHAKVVHVPFSGGPLGATPFWRSEAALYRTAGIKTVVIPYGADAHLYSRIGNTSMHNALLIDYPAAGRYERQIAQRVEYWTEEADCVLPGPIVYGIGRWDATIPSILCIDVDAVPAKPRYSAADGRNGPVRVVHSPNHRGFKGTEFLLHAVEALRGEGLQIELVLLEKVPNERVMQALQEADILAEQFIAGMYALNAIEGMATGVAVMSNVEDAPRAQLFRRFGYLDECPILSTTIETIRDNLRRLVVDPALREQLGRAGRRYAEKYHSYEAGQYIFSSVYARIVEGREVDLMNLFHPLKSAFNKRTPPVAHPLKAGRLVEEAA